MAWTDPKTYIAGAILTAAQMNAMQANALAGGPIYATEAARTTAIPSPFEGQRAYITGSTVAAATGVTTAVPTGIQTIYNGAAWVCVTPVGARTVTDGTTNSATYTTTLAGGGTNCTVTLATGTTALVSFNASFFTGTALQIAAISVSVSGATTLAGSDDYMVNMELTSSLGMGRSFIITGLTAGNNVFSLCYRSAGTNTMNAGRRTLTVQGIA